MRDLTTGPSLAWTSLQTSSGWSSAVRFHGSPSADEPTLAVHDGRLHCIQPDSGRLSWTYCDESAAGMPGTWSAPRDIAVGTAVVGAPVMASYPKLLHCVYRTPHKGASVMWTLVLGEDGAWLPGARLVDDALSDPVLSVHDGRLHLLYLSGSNPAPAASRLRHRVFDGKAWSEAPAPPLSPAENFAVASGGGVLHCVSSRAMGNGDAELTHCTFDGVRWSEPRLVTRQVGSSRPGLAVSGGTLYAAYAVPAPSHGDASPQRSGRARTSLAPPGRVATDRSAPGRLPAWAVRYVAFDGLTWSVPRTVPIATDSSRRDAAPPVLTACRRGTDEETLLVCVR
ncbi:hypothetical protein ACGFYV_14330 [Streptomyces sp. NPDC048297]|uniref:hypothetical protein n=1 Tax=Streptomyces sp. NPDC048297 TaxID=3365531 RepID=UPI00371172EA